MFPLHSDVSRFESESAAQLSRNNAAMAIPGIALVAHQGHASAQCRCEIVKKAGVLRKVSFVVDEEGPHISRLP